MNVDIKSKLKQNWMTRKGESDLINPQSLCFKSAHIYKISEKEKNEKIRKVIIII